MGEFDNEVDEIMRRISMARRERDKREQRAQSAAHTAENMFGNVGTLIKELQERLMAEYPAGGVRALMGQWHQIEDRIVNTVELNNGTRERTISLALVIGQPQVMIDAFTVPCDRAYATLVHEIENFLSQD